MRFGVCLSMAPDATQNGHGIPCPDHWSAPSWRSHASRGLLDTTAGVSVIDARTLRHELRRWLDEEVTEHAAADITLTAYEAIAEIITRADPLDPGPLRLQARLDSHQVQVTNCYTGGCTSPSGPEQSQCRLTLIQALTDHASFHREPHTITVHLTTYRQSPAQCDGHQRR